MHFIYMVIKINYRSKKTYVVTILCFLFSGPFYVLHVACSKGYDVRGSYLLDNQTVELLCS